MYCHCGCGGVTEVSQYSHERFGYVKGQHRKYINGHATRKRNNYVVIENGCWIWKGAVRHGYGAMYVGTSRADAKTVPAHKAHYEAKYGAVPDGLVLDHFYCDNPLCCNPDHVKPSTNANNVRRGRKAKITMDMAREIRLQKDTPTGILAERFGITPRQVSRIRRDQQWREETCTSTVS